MTLVNRRVTISGEIFSMSSTHRNLSTSLSCPAMDTIRNASSMSPVTVTLLVLKLGMMSSMFCVSVGPVCR